MLILTKAAAELAVAATIEEATRRVMWAVPPNRGRQRRASAAKRSPLHAGLGGAVEYGRAPANKGGTEDYGEERQGIREEFGRRR